MTTPQSGDETTCLALLDERDLLLPVMTTGSRGLHGMRLLPAQDETGKRGREQGLGEGPRGARSKEMVTPRRAMDGDITGVPASA